MRQDCRTLILCAGLGLLAAGCPKGHSEYDLGAKAENLQDYDAALDYYQKAVKVDPHNATFRIRLNQARFEAGEMHIKRGLERSEERRVGKEASAGRWSDHGH